MRQATNQRADDERIGSITSKQQNPDTGTAFLIAGHYLVIIQGIERRERGRGREGGQRRRSATGLSKGQNGVGASLLLATAGVRNENGCVDGCNDEA